jgi:Tfp pilus assembly protein PilV
MIWSEVLIGVVLAVGLLALALYYARRQLASLRKLRQEDALPDEERRYERRKAWRRLVSCGLMVIVAGLLFGLQFYAAPAQEMANERAGVDVQDLTPQQKFFIRAYTGAWIALLLVLMVILALAAIDLWATRRYGLRQYRKLSEDRRAMIQRQVNRMRQERNGH